MINAKCDNCGKDLGAVPIESILVGGRYRSAVSLKRTFKLSNRSDGGHNVACSIECAEQIAKDPKAHSSNVHTMPDGKGGLIIPNDN